MPIHIKGSGGAQKNPEISVDYSDGVITAKAGEKSTTYNLPVQTTKTVTPGKATQTAVGKGILTTGAVLVEGDQDLLPQNIVSGVSIFGVAGSAKPAQSVSQTFYGEGTKTASIYTDGIQFEKVMAICINSASAPSIDFGASTLIYVDGFVALTIHRVNDGADGFGVNGYGCNVTNENGWITVELPFNTATTFQNNLRYDALIIGY